MNDNSTIAATLLSAAVTRTNSGAVGDLVQEFWRLFDIAEGLGTALDMLSLDDGQYHPMTIRGARILYVGKPDEPGVPIRWVETDRDGNETEREAFLGSLRLPHVRVVREVAAGLVYTGEKCTLVVSYERPDPGWQSSEGKTPQYLRRVVRIAPLDGKGHAQLARGYNADDRAAQPGPPTTAQPPLTPGRSGPVPLEVRPAPASEEPAAADPFGLFGRAVTLTEGLPEDEPLTPGTDAFRAFADDWASLGGTGQKDLRRLVAGTGAQIGHKPNTVGELRLLADVARQLPVPA